MPCKSQTFEIKCITDFFSGSRCQIHLDRRKVIFHINFGSSQQPFSLNEKLLKLWQIKITNLLTYNLTYIKYLFQAYSITEFCCREGISCCHLHYRDYCEIGVHFFEKNKDIMKKGNCANNFQYRLNFSKKKLKSKLLSGKQFFQPKLATKDEKRQCRMDSGKFDVKSCSEPSE